MKCDFCDERKGIETVYNKIYGNRCRVVYETEHFSVFPCMGQLREGHLLAACKEHMNAIGNLKEEVLEELENLILLVSRFYKSVYDMNLLCFEHGVLSDDGSNGGCGIYHMHLHLLPVKENEFRALLEKLKNQKTNKIHLVQGLADTCHYIEEKKTYVYLEQIDRKQKKEMYIVSSSENYFESQYMRRMICEVFHNNEWNWRKVNYEEPEFLKTLEMSKRFFQKQMNIIVAVDKNWAIGKNNRLMWSIPADMKFFRETTKGNIVIMGRKTLESFPQSQPLKNRVNIVITRNANYKVKDAVVVHSVEEALEECRKYEGDVYVIGGESIYRAMLPYCDKALVTKIDHAYDADTYFPNLDKDPEWRMTKISEEQTCFDLEYYFTVYERISK